MEHMDMMQGIGKLFYKDDIKKLFKIKETTFNHWLSTDHNNLKTLSKRMGKKPFWREADLVLLIEGL